jgi:hypothetical protein
VLVLVREQHVVDEAVGQQPVLGIQLDLAEHLERPLANLVHVGADLVGPEDRQFPPDLAGLLNRVVELAQVAAQRLATADPLDEPELLEVADVTEIPDQRAEDRVVDPIELLVGERLDQLEGVTACFIEAPGQLGLAVGSGTRATLSGGCCSLRDGSRLPTRDRGLGARVLSPREPPRARSNMVPRP